MFAYQRPGCSIATRISLVGWRMLRDAAAESERIDVRAPDVVPLHHSSYARTAEPEPSEFTVGQVRNDLDEVRGILAGWPAGPA